MEYNESQKMDPISNIKNSDSISSEFQNNLNNKTNFQLYRSLKIANDDN